VRQGPRIKPQGGLFLEGFIGWQTFALTTGPGTFVGGPGANAVYGTAATLNAGDSLTGGSGTMRTHQCAVVAY
jgi:hypothetical protein